MVMAAIGMAISPSPLFTSSVVASNRKGKLDMEQQCVRHATQGGTHEKMLLCSAAGMN
jgi:hypothetical protein